MGAEVIGVILGQGSEYALCFPHALFPVYSALRDHMFKVAVS